MPACRPAERTLLGAVRHDDVDGWEIPGRYLGFLRGGPAEPLRAVVRHNDEDVRSLARLLVLLDAGYASRAGRRSAPTGDLAGLARAFSKEHRHGEALDCLDEALGRAPAATAAAIEPRVLESDDDGSWPQPGTPAVPWWSPRARPDFGGRPTTPDRSPSAWHQAAALAAPWDAARIGDGAGAPAPPPGPVPRCRSGVAGSRRRSWPARGPGLDRGRQDPGASPGRPRRRPRGGGARPGRHGTSSPPGHARTAPRGRPATSPGTPRPAAAGPGARSDQVAGRAGTSGTRGSGASSDQR